MKISNKVALIGDLHIGVNKNSEDFYNLTKEWIKYFIDYLETNKINTVFVLGDWHHYRDEISVHTLDVSSEIMSMFPKNIRVHILTGNHDCYFKDTSEIHSLQMFKGWENIFIYDKSTYLESISGDKIHIIPWGCALNDTMNSDYIFGHFEIQNFKMNNFTICDKGVESKDLLSKSKNIYTGHFHKYQNKKYKNGSITYVGSPFQHNFNDVENENGFHILDLTSGESEFIKNENKYPVFKYVKLTELKHIKEYDIYNNWVKLFIDINIAESQLEKLTAKMWSYRPKNLIIDDITHKNTIDNVKSYDTIEVINIMSSIVEFVDSLDDRIKYKEKTIKKLNKFYEEQNK